METREFRIENEYIGMRLDKASASLVDLSRGRIKELLDNGNILVNGKACKASYSLEDNDIVSITLPDNEEMEILAEDIPLDIVYEDSDVIVINKPKGMVVHPAPGHYSGTLVNALLYHCDDLSGINGVMRPGIVHRIDKDTTGLIVACKNDKAHASLSEQLANKTCHREYVAIVHHPFSHEFGTINAPIGRSSTDRQKMAVTAKNSKEAITHFTVLENFKDYAYIRCKLETGRTHQIRVHMLYIEHPIAGDPKYGYRKTIQSNGQLLHACALEFVHPSTKELMRFEVEPDEEFNTILNKLRNEEAV